MSRIYAPVNAAKAPANAIAQYHTNPSTPIQAEESVTDSATLLNRSTQLGHTFEQAEVSAASLQPATSGRPLPKPLREKMETAFDTDFSNVRVHEDENAEKIGALAYTRGNRLHFAPGKYRPHSTEGQKNIGHELAHVMQQRSGRVPASNTQGIPINADPHLEAEADSLGEQALQNKPLAMAEMSQPERSPTNLTAPIQAVGLFRKKAPLPKLVQNQPIKFSDSNLDPNVPPQDGFAGGAINQVDRLTYQTPIGKTMKTGYFKEDKVLSGQDFEGRALDQYKRPIDVGTAAESTGVALDDPRLANRSVATSRYAQLLQNGYGQGPGNTIATTEFAIHNNKYGSVSEEAPGRPLKQGINEEVVDPAVLQNLQSQHGRSYMVDDATGKEIIRPGNAQKAVHPSTPNVAEDPSKFYRLNADDYYRSVDFKNPVTQKGLSDLQIVDALTGQVDRHGGNVHIDNSGNVMGIDHDAAFGKDAKDPTKLKSTGQANDPMKGSRSYGLPPLVGAETARMVKHLKEEDVRKQLTGLLTDDEIEASVSRLHTVKGHIKSLKRSGGIVGRKAKFREKNHPQAWDDSTYATLTTPANREKSYLGHFVDSYEKAVAKGPQYAEGPIPYPPPLPPVYTSKPAKFPPKAPPPPPVYTSKPAKFPPKAPPLISNAPPVVNNAPPVVNNAPPVMANNVVPPQNNPPPVVLPLNNANRPPLTERQLGYYKTGDLANQQVVSDFVDRLMKRKY